MPRTSYIVEPANQPLIIIKQWQLDITDNDHCAAALISFYKYWHEIKMENLQQISKYNKVKENHGETPQIEIGLLQFHTQEDLENGLLGLFGISKIKESNKKLLKLGFISVHKNPCDRYKFDNTNYFLFHPKIVQNAISSLKIALVENDQRLVENDQTRTETTFTSSYIPKTTESESFLENFKNFELGEELSTIIQMNHKLTESELVELVFIFKSETKYLEKPPTNLHKTLLNWVKIKVQQKAEMNSKLREIELKSNQRIESENELQAKIAQTKLAKYQTASASNPSPTYSKSYQKPYQSSNYDVIEVDPNNFETEEEMRLFMLKLDEESKIYKTLRPNFTRERIWAENKESVKDVKNISNCSQIEIVQVVEPKEKVFEITPNLENEKIEKIEVLETPEQIREKNRQIMLEAMKKKNPKLAENYQNSQSPFIKIANKLLTN